MNLWQKIQSGFRALFRKEELDREMDEEMRAHIELCVRRAPPGCERHLARLHRWISGVPPTRIPTGSILNS
jgi:hypothetical protein